MDAFQHMPDLIAVTEQFAFDHPGFRVTSHGMKSWRDPTSQEAGLAWLPCVTMLHEASGLTFEDWAGTFEDAMHLALANLEVRVQSHTQQ
jgi:hypothetical protein